MEIHDCKTFASRTGTEINKSSFSSISEYEKKHILAITNMLYSISMVLRF